MTRLHRPVPSEIHIDPRDHLHYDFWRSNNASHRDIMENLQKYPFPQQREILFHLLQEGSLTPSTYHLLSSLTSYVYEGQNVYVLEKELTRRFQNTSLRNVDQSWIELPHPCFYVSLPHVEFKIYSFLDGWQRIRGVYITQSPGLWRFVMVSDPSWNKKEQAWGEVLTWFTFSWGEFEKGKDSGSWADVEDYLHHLMRNRLYEVSGDPREVSDWISNPGKERLKDLGISENEVSPEALEKSGIYKGSSQSGMGVLRLVFNLCLYIKTAEKDLYISDYIDKVRRGLTKKIQVATHKRKSRKVSQLQKKLATLPESRISFLGRSIDPVPYNKDRKKSSSTSTNSLEYEKKIPGHWKRQWYGSENPNSSAGPRRCEVIYVFGYSQGPEGVIRPGANVVVVEDR